MSNDKRDNEPGKRRSLKGPREGYSTPNRYNWSITVDQIGATAMVTLRDHGNCELQPDQLSDLRQARTWVKGITGSFGPMESFFNFGLQGGWSERQLIDLWFDPNAEVGPPDAVMRAKQMTLDELGIKPGQIKPEHMTVDDVLDVEESELTDKAINVLAAATDYRYASEFIDQMGLNLHHLQRMVYDLNVKAGWWSDLETGEPKVRNDGELLMLMVTELAEAMEGVRKNLMDDKLPHRKMVEVELADTIIRILDYAGGRNLDVAGALIEKLAFNQTREDHTRAARLGPNGKKV